MNPVDDSEEAAGYVLDNLVSETFSGNEMVIGLFGGFTMDTFMMGFEYNQYTNFDNAFTVIDGGDGLFGGDDQVSGLYTTYGDVRTSTLISTYFSAGLTPKFNTFIRADIYDPNIAEDALEDAETDILLGFHFYMSEYFDLAPVIKHSIIDSDEEASTDFMLNFQFKF